MENIRRYPREIFWIAALVLVLSPLFRFSWDIAPQTLFHLIIIGSLCLFLARHRISLTRSPEIPLALFLLAAVLSFFAAADRSVARNGLFTLFDALAFTLLFSFLPGEEKERLLIIPSLVGVWLAVMALMFLFFPPKSLYFAGLVFTESLVNMNAVAGFLIIALILSFIPIHGAFRLKGSAALPFILFAGLVATKSRSAIIAGSLGASIYLWPYISSRLRRAAVPIIVCLVLIIITISVVFKPWNPFSSRFLWWQSALNMTASHPFFGVGWGNFGASYLIYRIQPGLNSLYSHNVFLQIAAETGLAGLAAFLFVIVSFFRLYIRQPVAAPAVRAAGTACLAFLVFNVVDFSFFLPAHLFLLAACAGTLYERKAEPRPLMPSFPLYGLIFIFWAMIVIPPFAASRWYVRGTHFMNEGNVAAASHAFDKAVRLDTISPDYPNKYAELFFGKFTADHDPAFLARAISFQEKAVRASPVSAALWSDLAWLYRTAGRNGDALHALRQAVRYDPLNPVYKNNLLNFGQ